MFGFIEKRRYRSAVWRDVHLCMNLPQMRPFFKLYKVLDKHIDDDFSNGKQIESSATGVLSTIFSNIAETGIDDSARSDVLSELTAVGRNEVSVDADLHGLTIGFLSASRVVENWLEAGKIEQSELDFLVEDFMGALNGKDAYARMRDSMLLKTKEIGNEIIVDGPDDDSGELHLSPKSIEFPSLSGIKIKVSLSDTALGIQMINQDTKEPVTVPRTLTQEDLTLIPLDADRYEFVNFTSRSGEIFSCIIVEPDTQVIGNRRAFWWALAFNTVWLTAHDVNWARLTKSAFETMCATARTTWDSALRSAGSVDELRDQPLLIRNGYFEVAGKLKADTDSKAEHLGIDIAQAMILAVQSEDSKLEGFTYEWFKDYIWLSGEEPPEFRDYEAR